MTVKASESLPINGRGSTLNSDPTRNFRFLVLFQPYDLSGAAMKALANINFGFTSVSGLSMAVEAIPYREGGMNTTLLQIPGQASFSPVTLTRGIHLGNRQAWDWIRKLFAATSGRNTGSPVTQPAFRFRSSVTIHVLQHPARMAGEEGIPYGANDMASRNDPVSVSFRMYNAWIQSLAYSDLNAGDNAIMVEQMSLVHEGFDMFWQPSGSTANQADQRLFSLQ